MTRAINGNCATAQRTPPAKKSTPLRALRQSWAPTIDRGGPGACPLRLKNGGFRDGSEGVVCASRGQAAAPRAVEEHGRRVAPPVRSRPSVRTNPRADTGLHTEDREQVPSLVCCLNRRAPGRGVSGPSSNLRAEPQANDWPRLGHDHPGRAVGVEATGPKPKLTPRTGSCDPWQVASRLLKAY